MTERIRIVFGEDVLEAFSARIDALHVRDRITLASRQIEAETGLDYRDLIDARQVVRPLRVDVDAALRAAARAGALKNFAVIAGNAAGDPAGVGAWTRSGAAAARRIDDAGGVDMLLPVLKSNVAAKHPAIRHAFGRCQFEALVGLVVVGPVRSEEHTSERQSHSFISYAVFCLKKKINTRACSTFGASRLCWMVLTHGEVT